MRSGNVSAQPPLEPRIDATAFGSWRTETWSTPRASINIQNPKNYGPPSSGGRSSKPGLEDQARELWPTATARDSESSGSRPDPSDKTLTDIAARDQTWRDQELWPTPATFDALYSMEPETYEARRAGVRAANQTPEAHWGGTPGPRLFTMAAQLDNELWPTPTSAEGARGTTPARKSDLSGGEALGTVASSWSTPTARDGKGPGLEHTKGGRDLATDVEAWPTPTAHDAKSTAPSQLERNSPMLSEAVLSGPPDPASAPSGASSETRCLNPLFVEWLMGTPSGWSDYMPLETGSFHSWWQRLSACLPSER